MSDQYQDESATAEPDETKMSLVGGFVGTVIGAQKSRGAAVVGGVVGGTLGYLAGAAAGPPETDVAEEPVVVTVDGTDEDEDEGTEADGTDDANEDEDTEAEAEEADDANEDEDEEE